MRLMIPQFLVPHIMEWHDDVIKWKPFLRHWPFVRGIHRSPVNSPHKGQWRGALMFSFIWTSIDGWVNNRETGDLRRHRAHYDVTVIEQSSLKRCSLSNWSWWRHDIATLSEFMAGLLWLQVYSAYYEYMYTYSSTYIMHKSPMILNF